MTNPNIKKQPYHVVLYDPKWAELYEKYKQQIASILSDELVEIHHYGSTSIPGMFAKPNIDIYTLAKSLEAVRKRRPEFEKFGFKSRGDYSRIGEEYFTIDTPSGERIASVHIFEGSPKVFEDFKNFHDYLIAHDDERQRYIDLKKQLYEKYKDDYPAYDAGKLELIKELLLKANKWVGKS